VSWNNYAIWDPGGLEVGRAILPAGALSSAPKPAESRLAANIGCPTKMKQLFLYMPLVNAEAPKYLG